MFNLDQAIAEWHQQMRDAGIKTPTPLEELEIHLREEIERQMQSGLDAQKAFAISTLRMGQPELLKSEFKKTEKTPSKRLGILTVSIGTAIILRILTEFREVGHAWKGEQLEWFLVGIAVVLFGLGSATLNFKLGDARDLRLWKLVGITYSIFAVWISMLPICQFLTEPTLSAAFGMIDRTLAFTAVAASCLSVLGWRFGRGILPIVRDQRIRTAIGIACCLLGPGSMALFFLFFMPHLVQAPAPLFLVLLTWAWTMVTILGGVGYGLTEAAHRHDEPAVDS